MAFKSSRMALALSRTAPKLSAYGSWDPRAFGDKMRPFNLREMTEGYHNGMVNGYVLDFQGNPAPYEVPLTTWIRRWFGPLFAFWMLAFSMYYLTLRQRTPGAPWSQVYDPSRERSF